MEQLCGNGLIISSYSKSKHLKQTNAKTYKLQGKMNHVGVGQWHVNGLIVPRENHYYDRLSPKTLNTTRLLSHSQLKFFLVKVLHARGLGPNSTSIM